MKPAKHNKSVETLKARPANSLARLGLIVRGTSPGEDWSCRFDLELEGKAPPQLWLVSLPSRCANPARRLRRVGPGCYQLEVKLLGPAMPVQIRNCDEAQQARWASQGPAGFGSPAALIAVLSAGGKIHVTVHQVAR
jgi:hypothetical protein